MQRVGEILRRPAVRNFYHIIVGTELRRKFAKFVNSKILQPWQNLGEELTYAQMIPLGPNGIKVVNPNSLMTTLGPNGNLPTDNVSQTNHARNNAAPPPPPEGKPPLTPTLDIKRAQKAIEKLKPKVGKGWGTLIYMGHITLGGLLGFFLPLKASIAAIPAVGSWLIGSSGWLLAAGVLVPNMFIGLVAGLISHFVIRRLMASSAWDKLVQSHKSLEISELEIAWVLAERHNELPESVKKKVKSLISNDNLVNLAQSIQKTNLKLNDKLVLFEILNKGYRFADAEKEIEALAFLQNLLSSLTNDNKLNDKIIEVKENLTGLLNNRSQSTAAPGVVETSKNLGLRITARDPDDVEKEYYLLPADPSKTEEQKTYLFSNAFFIGKGNMGEVYKALDPKTGQYVAVKLLTDLSFKEFFKKEYEVMKKIGNPSVVKVFGYGALKVNSEPHPFIIEEFVPWPDLAAYIRESGKKLDPKKAAKIALTIAEAMHGIAQLGISHRDLKAANIFISEPREGEFEVKISDFGLARDPEAKDKSSTGKVMGTPTHISPYYYEEYSKMSKSEREDPENQEHIERILTKNDIFALGAILYRMLTGLSLTWKFDNKFHQIGEQSEWEEMKRKNPNGWLVKNVEPISILTFEQLYTEYKIAINEGNGEKANRIKDKFTPVQAIGDHGFIIPDKLYHIVTQMTAFDPKETFNTFLEVKQALERYLHDDSNVTTAPTMVSQAPPPPPPPPLPLTGTREKIAQDLEDILLGNIEVEDPIEMMGKLSQLAKDYKSDPEIVGKVWDVMDFIKPRS
ncbi:MAG: serine/threonine-protein kinase [Candidatus Margulisiibacteriota bacterium]